MTDAITALRKQLAAMLGANRPGPTHAMFVSFTSEQEDLVKKLEEAVSAYLQLLHYKRGIQVGAASVAEEIEQWISHSNMSMGIYGTNEGYLDPELGKPVTHWEYERILASQKVFRAFIENGAASQATASQKAFLENLTRTVTNRNAVTFTSPGDFVRVATMYVGVAMARISSNRGATNRGMVIVITFLVLVCLALVWRLIHTHGV